MPAKIDIKADSKYPIDRKKIRASIDRVLVDRGVHEKVYVSVSVVGDRKMRFLNKKYRDKDYATDVLSFPTFDPTQAFEEAGFSHPETVGRNLGDIVVSYPQAVLIAARTNQMLDEVISFLVEHSVLHLLGIHHD